MQLSITPQELEQRGAAALEKLLASKTFDNPKFFDRDFVAHGKKRDIEDYRVDPVQFKQTAENAR